MPTPTTRTTRTRGVRGAVAAFALLVGATAASRGVAQPASPPRPVDLAQPPQTVRLWPGRAPGALGDEDRDTPILTLYRPFGQPYTSAGGPTAGTAVIVAPGGGYAALAENHEGRQIASWLNGLGVTAFVLRYRLGPRYHHPVELGDMQRAIRLVRARAGEFGVVPNRIGVMGFSAGGHLAATAATHADDGDPRAADSVDRSGSRPDFLVLAYPVVSLSAPYTHQGSATNLLGADASPALRAELSNEQHVTPRTPPTFLFSTNADNVVPAENSVAFYLALRRAGVPAELHVFEPGPHGVGLALGDPVLGVWPSLLATWLRGRGLLTRPPAGAAGRTP